MKKFTLKNKSLNWEYDSENYDFFINNVWPSIEKIDGYLSMCEAFFLFEIAKNIDSKSRLIDLPPEQVVLEIGSYKGKSTVAIGKGLKLNKKKYKLICIDTILNKENQPNHYDEFNKNIKDNHLEDIIEIIPLQSSEAIKKWPFTRGINLLWIDGNHEFEYVSQDLLLWSRYLRPGGIVAFHDWYLLGVRETILNYIFNSIIYQDVKVIDGNLVSAKKYDVLPSKKDLAIKQRIYWSLINRNNSLLFSLFRIIFNFIDKPFGNFKNFLFSKPKIKKF